MKRGKAVTLIELLIVVAIITVLAAIAVPNFLEAQVRSKTSRAEGDMAMVMASLRAYYADYHCYPPNAPPREARFREWWPLTPREIEDNVNAHDQAIGRLTHDWFRYTEIGTSGYDLSAITTPIAYLSKQLPSDPYCDARGTPLVYMNVNGFDGETSAGPATQHPRFVVLSYGPDTDSSRWPQGDPYDVVDHHPLKGPFTHYDPTNGTISVGDIFLTGS